MSSSKALGDYFYRVVIPRLPGNITAFSYDILNNTFHASGSRIYASAFFLFLFLFFHSTGIPSSYTDAWAISKKSM